MTWPAALTHLLVFTLGVATWLPFTLWEGRRVTRRPDERTQPVPHNPLSDYVRRRPPVLVTVLLVAAALMIGFGVQQMRYQDDAKKRDACYQSWGDDMIDTLTTRVASNGRVDEADKDRQEALDNIVLVIIQLRAQPPQARDSDLDVVLARFAAARARLQNAEDRAERTRRANPYPLLRCGDTPDEDSTSQPDSGSEG